MQFFITKPISVTSSTIATPRSWERKERTIQETSGSEVRALSNRSSSVTYFCAQGGRWSSVEFASPFEISTNQGYLDKLVAHKRWVKLLLENAACLCNAFEKAGRRTALDPKTECLRVDDAINVCVRVARCYEYRVSDVPGAPS